MLLGFWFVLRSIEYLAGDDGVYDPGLTVRWEALSFVFRKQGDVLPVSRIQEADEMTIVVYSAKGSLHTCTRTLMANPDSKTCVVAAHKKLHATYIISSSMEKPPRKLTHPTGWKMHMARCSHEHMYRCQTPSRGQQWSAA